MPKCWPAFIVAFLLVSCSAGSTSGRGFLDLPSAHASAPLAPAADFAVGGRLLLTKASGLYQWSAGNLKPLAGGFRFDSPAFSPDSRRIAVSIVGRNHSDIVLLDSSGKQLVQLTDNWSKVSVQDSVWAHHPAWSPDGQQLAFASDYWGSQMSLWLVDATGERRRQLYSSPVWGGVDDPAWSPDGRGIALTVFEPTGSQIFLVDSTTGVATKLLESDGGVYDAAWSPDGERLAFVRRTQGRSDIWVANRDGKNAVRVSDLGTARSPAWSPDGNFIAFFADRGNGFDLHVLKLKLPDPALAAPSDVKRLTDGQNLDAPSGISWTR